MKSKGRSSKESKLMQCIKAPYRALLRARDLYVRSMTGCAGRAQRGPIMAMPRAQSRSFHSRRSSSEDDIGELIRAASRSRLRSMPVKSAAVPRSHSVATMRIDEEEPGDLEEEVDVKVAALGPRSRSCDVVSKGKVGFLA